MGEVYRAKDTNLNRYVALKILPDAFALDADRVARFKREAQLLASLNHPNIAPILGIESNALVMELVEGEDLSAHIARGAMPLADALEAAHEAGIIRHGRARARGRVVPQAAACRGGRVAASAGSARGQSVRVEVLLQSCRGRAVLVGAGKEIDDHFPSSGQLAQASR